MEDSGYVCKECGEETTDGQMTEDGWFCSICWPIVVNARMKDTEEE